jgi:hypothetical protein
MWRAPAAIMIRDVSPPDLGSTGSAVHLCVRNLIGGLGPLGARPAVPGALSRTLFQRVRNLRACMVVCGPHGVASVRAGRYARRPPRSRPRARTCARSAAPAAAPGPWRRAPA